MRLKECVDEFVRPNNTTAYSSGQLVANSTSSGSVTPLSFNVSRGGIKVVTAKVTKTDETDVANATFRLHLFGSEPTVANGDGATISFNESDYIGYITFPTMVAATDLAYAKANVGDSSVDLGYLGLHHYASSASIYGLLEARAAYSPAAEETFSVTLTVERY